MTTTKPAYDLEERTLRFAQAVARLVATLPKGITNVEYAKQLARSAGSIGANYIEANDGLSKKDFLMRAKIAKKKAKESRYWLQLVEPFPEREKERNTLLQESTEIMKILGAIVERSKERV